MQAIELRAFGVENLVLTERESRAPGPGEIRIAMRAASINYRDLLMVEGEYNPRQRLPLVPLSDGVGVVKDVGPGVTRFAVGDRVSPIFAPGWWAGEPSRAKIRHTLGGPSDGTLQTEMTLNAEDAVAVPTYLSDQEAACLPCAGVTAWSALQTYGRLAPGESVLIQGTGGVSMLAMQIALASGARVIVTSSSNDKLDRLRHMGVHHTLNYIENPEWGKAAKELAGGDGVDHVVEVGGAGTLTQSLRAVRPGGNIYVIGVLAGKTQELSVIPILMQNIRVQGILVGHREGFEALNRAFDAHTIRPTISHAFAWTDIADAFEVMRAGRHFGKIVLTFGDTP